MRMNERLKAVLDQFECSTDVFYEHSIVVAIMKSGIENIASDIALLAEVLAFNFWENYTWEDNQGWGTYYGPKAVWVNNDGTSTESPSITEVTPDVLDYWETRAQQSNHSILKARYADLVYDFSKTVTGKSANYNNAQIVIDANIDIAKTGCYKYDVSVIPKLKRALSLSLAINDNVRVENSKQAIIEYEKKVAIDNMPGLWGFAFDLLIKENKGILSEKEEKEIVQSIEERISRLSADGEPIEPWAVETGALRLAEYYRKKGEDEKVVYFLNTIEKAYELKCKIGEPMQIMAWWQKVHDIYLQFNKKENAERIRGYIKEVGPKVRDSMKSIKVEMNVTTEEFENYINALTEGGLENALVRVMSQYVPRKDEVENQLQDLSKKAPVSFLFPSKIIDDRGRIIAHVDALESDLEGNVVQQISQDISFSSIFLRKAIERIIEKYGFNTSKLVDFIFESPLFDQEKHQLIVSAIDFYFGNNYIASIHILIPQIEAAFRRLLELSGQSVLKVSRSGGFFYKTFDEILRDPIIEQVFREDTSLYLRILFTDPRGWNIRNDVCHGIAHPNIFNQTVADRMIHVLLILGIVREKEKARKDDETNTE